MPRFVQEHDGPARFIHIDCDLYSSTVTILREMREKIVEGTVILFDEYFNYPGWQRHEYKAFDEFVERSGVVPEYLGFASSYFSVCVRIVSIAR